MNVTNVSRIVSLAAAVVITAVEWAALSSPQLPSQRVAVPVAGEPSNAALPVIVVMADRQA
jgi:hypothetical protein